ncbi:MAG TPA: transglutaminase-like domain-containing protein [Verrucomicrobiae bacterium]|nr:transglutaminase-like domain-containing protein [Verrucomicrobiae bacterium]
MVTDPYQAFRQAVDRPEEQIDLGRAALTIALPDYPNLDLSAYLIRIDELAVQVAHRAGAEADDHRTLAALNHVLFTEHGFCGNRDDYYDPKNSFLNEVLERKTGIPISLSVLFIEIGRRVGMDLAGVGFPGHFLVRCRRPGDEVVIDPFSGGALRSRSDLECMLRDLYGGHVRLTSELLHPVSKKQILKRMLGNLRAVYLKKNDLVKCLSVFDRLIILDSGSAVDFRDRGMVYVRLECAAQAREDFQTYLRLAPHAEDAGAIREQIIQLGRQATTLH